MQSKHDDGVGGVYLVVVDVRYSSSDDKPLLNSRLYHSILFCLVLHTSSTSITTTYTYQCQ